MTAAEEIKIEQEKKKQIALKAMAEYINKYICFTHVMHAPGKVLRSFTGKKV